MAEILSQEEIDALLSAVSYGEEVEVQEESSKSERLINTYDFRHPARVSKDQLRTLQNLHAFVQIPYVNTVVVKSKIHLSVLQFFHLVWCPGNTFTIMK